MINDENAGSLSLNSSNPSFNTEGQELVASANTATNMGPFNSKIHDSNDQDKSVEVTFNMNLPANHQYLGTDLEEMTPGQNVFESGSVIENVPLLPIPHFVLMPNQILPLNNFHPHLISMFRTIIANAKCFGVINTFSERDFEEDDEEPGLKADVGTLAQVLAFKENTEHELTAMLMRVVGRQRFKVLSSTVHNGILIGTLSILPEIELGNLPQSVEPINFQHSGKRRCKFVSASIYAPSFVPRSYDVKVVVHKIIRELKQWYEGVLLEDMAHNSMAFSFWVAANLPIPSHAKLFLLSLNCDLQRLRYELSLLQQCTAFYCRHCQTRIGRKSYVFSMSYMGPLGVYVNPAGSLHELLTLNRLETGSCVRLFGRPQTEYSWFPGYAWTIMQCSQCNSHLGWKFTVDKKFRFEPKEFWGVTRSSIYLRLADEEAGDEDEFINKPSL